MNAFARIYKSTRIWGLHGTVIGLSFFLPRLAWAQPDDMHSNVLKRESMEMIWNDLLNHGVRVAFLAVPHDQAAGVTMAQRAKQIQAIPEADRTFREKTLLQIWQQGHIPDTSIVSYGDDNLSITLPKNLADPVTTHETLQKIVALDSRYELVWFGNFPVICPHKDELRDVRVDLSLKDVDAFEAVGLLGKELARHNVNFGEAHIGPGNPADDYGHNKITLNLVHVPLMDALTQFCNALGPCYTWEILGTKGFGENCGITRVAPPE